MAQAHLVNYSLKRYGENPSQKGYLISNKKNSIFSYQISGKQISYNNLIDIDSGLKCLKEFNEPTSIILKHTNPCGIASAKNIEIAFNRSYESDPKSAFGGIILLNRKVTSKLAMKIYKNFYEMIVALDFNRDALKILKQKKNLILIKIPNIKKTTLEYKSTLFGDLYQTTDLSLINRKFLSLVSKKKGSTKTVNDLIFSLKVVKHLKSNAIALVKNKQLVGVGCGQTSRIDALKTAETGDLEKTNRLLKVLSEPYKIQSSIQDLQTSPKPSKIPYKTFCGT